MKKVLIICAVLVLSGCGQVDRFGAALTGSAKSCIDGVEYLQFASGVTVKYNRDGSISTCK